MLKTIDLCEYDSLGVSGKRQFVDVYKDKRWIRSKLPLQMGIPTWNLRWRPKSGYKGMKDK